jgi:hypothetical protein
MKTISALLLGLSVSLLLNSTATAEPFNDRDQHYSTTVTSNPQNKGMSGDEKSTSYEEGLYEDVPWSYLAPAGSQEPREPAVAQPEGFNS